MKYNLIIIIYILSIIVIVFSSCQLNNKIGLILLATFVFLTITFWATAFISSQMFVKTFCKAKKNGNKIALTFDDGPDLENTPQILNLLSKYNAKASFFVIGQKIETHSKITRDIYEAGHLIGNHTYSHKAGFSTNNIEQNRVDIEKTQLLIKEITGEDCKYFRPPFGVTSPLVKKSLKMFKFTIVGWSIRSFDKYLNRKWALEGIIRRIKAGDIVLLHDTNKDIVWILERVLKHLSNKNLKATRIDDLID